MRLSIILFGLTTLFSCKKEKTSINPLVGDWSLIMDSTREEDFYRNPRHGKGKLYSFLNDSVVDTKTFYHKRWNESNKCEEFWVFDSKTSYDFSGDTLLILNPVNGIWDSIGRIRLSKDTLKVFRGDNTFLYKKKDSPKAGESFDQIILSSSSCFGTCPVTDVSIKSNGQVYFNGDSFVENLGPHESQISRDLFDEIKENFVRADFFNLNESYQADWTDDFTVSVTFIKKGRIIKTITDYGEVSPPDFVFAYQKLKYLLQSVQFKPLNQKLLYDSSGHYKLLIFENNDRQIWMSDSESFFLSYLLNRADETSHEFDEIYTLVFFRSAFRELCRKNQSFSKKDEKINKITTDGRFYKFYFKDEEPIILDIEHNFISESKPFLRFIEKH